MDDESAELSALRARAYGAGAQGISETDAARLHELEAHRRRVAPAVEEERRRAAAHDPGSGFTGPRSDEASDAADSTGSVVSVDESPRAGLSGVVKLVLVVAAALIPVAAITGYLAASAFAEADEAPESTAPLLAGDIRPTVEEQRALVLESQEWDGDVTLWGAADDVAVWWGTTGDTTCAVILLESIGVAPVCAATGAAQDHGIREEIEFFHADGDDFPEDAGVLDVSDVRSTRIVFSGNPYTGQFMLVRED